MDPVIAQSLAALISAVATVILMAGTYYFGRGKRRPPQDEDEPS